MDDEFEPRSIFGVETERAVRRLRKKLKGYLWYVGVGSHGGVEQAGLIVYVRSDDHPEIDGRKTFRGFSVKVENIVAAGERAGRKHLEHQLQWMT